MKSVQELINDLYMFGGDCGIEMAKLIEGNEGKREAGRTERGLTETMETKKLIEEAIRRLKAFESVKNQIALAKRNMHSKNSDYLDGYLSALSAVERMIARADESE